MSMNNKILLVFISFVVLFGFSFKVNAANTCIGKSKSVCQSMRECNWNATSNSCQDVFLAEDPCGDKNILKAMNFFGYLLLIARVAIPLVIIVVGTFDLFKSVVDKDEKSLSKQVKILGVRIVAGVFVFFIPTIIYALFGISTTLNIVEDAKYNKCVDCLLEPTQCQLN